MRALIVTNMYPTDASPYYGIFVKEQLDAVTHFHPDVHYDVYFADGRVNKLNYLKSVFEVDRLVRHGKYDLVHIHYGLAGLFMLNPFRHKIPSLVTLHGGDIQIEQGKKYQVAISKRVIARANAAITLNDSMTALCGRYSKNLHQLPCSVNIELFTPPSTPREKAAGSINLVFPGSPSRTVKNYPLFKATVTLLQNHYGLHVNEIILENMTRAEIADALRRADLMLLTSISEGSPQVVKEAMATNLPVVSTNVGDVTTLLDGVADSYVTDSTPEALADKVMESIKLSGAGMTGRERLVQLGLDDNTVANKIYDIYSSLIKTSVHK